MKYFMTLFLVSLLLLSCSQGENQAVNAKNKDLEKTKIGEKITKPKKLFSISEPIMPIWVDFDNNSNIYILDGYDFTIKKYNRDGKFLLKFGGKGLGPGELNSASSFTILDSLVVLADFPRKIYPLFNLKGKFIKDLKANKFVTCLNALTNEEIAGNVLSFEKEDDKMYLNIGIGKSDLAANVKVYYNQKCILDDNYQEADNTPIYVAAAGKFFITKRDFSNLKIDVLDSDGKKLYEVHKNYAAIPYTAEELEQMKKMYQDLKYKKYKYLVRSLNLDGKGRLWLEKHTQNERKSVQFDLFKDDKFIGSLNMGKVYDNSDQLSLYKHIFIKGNIMAIINELGEDNGVDIYRLN